MPILNTEAITLRRRRTRDADALVTLWGKSCGKIVVSTRSVLKTSSRYAGITQPFNRIQAILYAKIDDQEIWTLTQTSLLESYHVIQNDLNRMAYASNLVEWIDALSAEFQSSRRIWDLLTNLLARWNHQVPTLEEILYYQLHLLIDAGMQPQIQHCQNCNQTGSRQWYYVTRQGGLFCGSCGREGLSLSGGTVEILRRLSESEQPLSTLRISPQQTKEIQIMLHNHAVYHVGLQSRSIQFQEQMQKNGFSQSPPETAKSKEGTLS